MCIYEKMNYCIAEKSLRYGYEFRERLTMMRNNILFYNRKMNTKL